MKETASRPGESGRAVGSPRPRPIIAVSRQHGARGAAVARLVAERMSYTCWDRELLGAIGSHVRLEPAHVAALDERCHEPGNAALHAARPGRSEYLRGLDLVARAIARRGSAVVVGRGVGFLLEDAECLRVRVVCPLERRVAGLVERARLSSESARATIEYVDRARREFVLARHGHDVDDPSSFDVVVSTGAMTVAAAADVVIATYHARFALRRWPRSTVAAPALAQR